MRNLILLLIPLYLGFHLFTLSRFPLPEFQEAVLASASNGIYKSGTGFINQELGIFEQKVIQSSPLYIYMNNALLNNMENILFTYRLGGLVFAVFLLVAMLVYLANLEKGSFNNAAVLLFLALLFDPFLNKAIHGQGSIIIACFFLLVSLRNEIFNKDYNFNSTVLSALFMALALLTYLPIISLVPFLLIFKLVSGISELLKKQYLKLYHFIFWSLFTALFYCPWPLLYRFDSFGTISTFLNPSFSWETKIQIPYGLYIILGGTVLLIIYAYFQKKYEIEYKRNLVLFSGLIISFFLSDPDWPKHIALALPFIYLFIFCLLPLNSTTNAARAGRYIPIGSLLTVNIILFIILTIFVASDFNNRSGVGQKTFISKFVPADQPVIGDARNCFGAIENRNLYLPLRSTLELNEKLSSAGTKYVLISDHFENRDRFAQNTLEYHNYQKVASYKVETSEVSKILSDLFLYGQEENDLYSTSVYRKKR